ncbi:MAG: hypothetical protein ABEJ73_02435 [Haloplanus sp.]
MVSDAILGALVGGGAAVAGSYVQAWFNRQNTRDSIRAQHDRKRVEHLLQKESEVLFDCLERMQTAHNYVLMHADDDPVTFDTAEFRRITADASATYQRAFPFVTETTQQSLGALVDQYRRLVASVGRGDGEFDDEAYDEVYRDASTKLYAEIRKPLADLQFEV